MTEKDAFLNETGKYVTVVALGKNVILTTVKFEVYKKKLIHYL